MAGEKLIARVTGIDQGFGLQVQIGLNEKADRIVLEYSHPCKWVELTAMEARALAHVLLKKAADLEIVKAGGQVGKSSASGT